METQIKAALISLLDGIKRADGTAIAAQMELLDGFLARGQAEGSLHPQLEHFLAKRSYAKALMFLGGETPAAGNCGNRKPETGKKKPSMP